MKLSRQSRFAVAIVAMFSILFMQLAVAGYACPDPALPDIKASVMVQNYSEHDGMAGCEGMDAEQPGLCHAHGQIGDQSLDKPGVPVLQPLFSASIAPVFRDLNSTRSAVSVPSDRVFLVRTTAPPLSIRNCCFRI